MKSTRFATLCVALGLASIFAFNTQAQITVDGTREVGYGAPLVIQSVTAGWGNNQVLASLSAVQQGGSLFIFLAGRPQGNAFMLFVDSKPGGVSFIPNNLIAAGGEEGAINNFGVSGTAGMTFEPAFSLIMRFVFMGTGGVEPELGRLCIPSL